MLLFALLSAKHRPLGPGTHNETKLLDRINLHRYASIGTNSRDSNDSSEWIVGIKTMEVVEQEKPPGFK